MREFPELFLKVHERAIHSQRPMLGRHYQVILHEPLVLTDGPMAPDVKLYTVIVRVDRGNEGALIFRPSTQSDLDVVEAWVKRHEGTPVEDFPR